MTEEKDEITRLRADVEKLKELADKYKWQVRDTCARAEAAEKRESDAWRHAAARSLAVRTAVRVICERWKESAQRALAVASEDPQTPEQWRAFGHYESDLAHAGELDHQDDRFEESDLAKALAKVEKLMDLLHRALLLCPADEACEILAEVQKAERPVTTTSAARDVLAERARQMMGDAMTKDEALKRAIIAFDNTPGPLQDGAAAFLASLRESGWTLAPVEATVKHKKRGTTYDVLAGLALLQTDTPLSDMAEVVVYRCRETGDFWVRPCSEFNDGRFAPLAAQEDESNG
jgi:hypothetical protein